MFLCVRIWKKVLREKQNAKKSSVSFHYLFGEFITTPGVNKFLSNVLARLKVNTIEACKKAQTVINFELTVLYVSKCVEILDSRQPLPMSTSTGTGVPLFRHHPQ